MKTTESKTTECTACRGLVSVQAKACPHCAEPRPAQKKGQSWFDVIAIVAVTAGALFLFGKFQEQRAREVAEIEQMKQEALKVSADLIRLQHSVYPPR